MRLSSRLAATVAASGDVADVDDRIVETSALLTNRPDELTVIDSKLYTAILFVLPKNDDGDRIHAAIKGNCASFCGRQALRMLEKDFQY